MTTSMTLSVSLSFGWLEKSEKASFICCGDTQAENRRGLNGRSRLPLRRFLSLPFYLRCEVCVLHHLIAQTHQEFFHVLFIFFSTMSGRCVIGKFNVCNQQSHTVRQGQFVRTVNLIQEKLDRCIFHKHPFVNLFRRF